MEQIYIDTTRILKALSDPKRLKIVDMLSQRELCAHSIRSAFDISQPTLSHDMRILKEAGVTLERREGKNIFYSLNSEALKQLLGILGSVFDEQDNGIAAEPD